MAALRGFTAHRIKGGTPEPACAAGFDYIHFPQGVVSCVGTVSPGGFSCSAV